jgi:hypothetical protein
MKPLDEKLSGFFSAPSMGADFAVKVRYTLGSEEC